MGAFCLRDLVGLRGLSLATGFNTKKNVEISHFSGLAAVDLKTTKG